MKKIGGDSGFNDGANFLEPVVHAIIEPAMLAKISWTGRGSKGKKDKIPMSKYVNILALITSLCQSADTDYDHDTCINDLKKKNLKYASSKYGEESVVDAESAPTV